MSPKTTRGLRTTSETRTGRLRRMRKSRQKVPNCHLTELSRNNRQILYEEINRTPNRRNTSIPVKTRGLQNRRRVLSFGPVTSMSVFSLRPVSSVEFVGQVICSGKLKQVSVGRMEFHSKISKVGPISFLTIFVGDIVPK